MHNTYLLIQETIKPTAGKWKPVILILLSKKGLSFNRIKLRLKKISSKVLVQNLTQLKKDGLIMRNHNSLYRLTSKGIKIADSYAVIYENLI